MKLTEASLFTSQLDANSFGMPVPLPPLSQTIFMPDALSAVTLPIYHGRLIELRFDIPPDTK